MTTLAKIEQDMAALSSPPASLSHWAGRVLKRMVAATSEAIDGKAATAKRPAVPGVRWECQAVEAAGGVVRIRVPAPSAKSLGCSPEQREAAIAELVAAGLLVKRPLGDILYTVECP